MQESGRSVGGAEGFTVDREPRWSVGVTWRGFSFLLKEAKFLMALCIAQQSNPTCALYYEAFSYKTCFANDPGSSPDKKRDAGMELLHRVQGLWNTSACRSVLSSAALAHLQPEKWIYSALNDFSKAGVWPVIYGGLELERNHISFLCYMPGFLCVP